MGEAYIKLHRKMLKWEWYDDVNTKVLFLHCLLRANWQPGSWHGIEYQAGEFITSLSTLAKETTLTVKQVRVALDHLIRTNEVASRGQGRCRIITVIKWNEYQVEGKVKGKMRARSGQDEGKMRATDKEYKEGEEGEEGKEIKKDNTEKKHKYGEYQHVLLTDKERDRLMNEYGEAETSAAIKFLDEYIEEKGYKSKNHNLAMRRWVFNAIREKKEQPKQSVFDAWMNA